MLEFLDANFDRAAGNIYMVGRPNFHEPSMDAAYDYVPVGLASRVVHRRNPPSTALWACHSAKAWAAVAAEFRATANVAATSSIRGNDVDHTDGSLYLPPRDKYGPGWWESTLRIIVYDAASASAAYGLERALAVPDGERGTAELELMVTSALYLEAVLRGYSGR